MNYLTIDRARTYYGLGTLVEEDPEEESSLDISGSSCPESIPVEPSGRAPANNDDRGSIPDRHPSRGEERNFGDATCPQTSYGALDDLSHRSSTRSSESSSWLNSLARMARIPGGSSRDLLELENSFLSAQHLGDEEQGMGGFGNGQDSEVGRPRQPEVLRGDSGSGSSIREAHRAEDGGGRGMTRITSPSHCLFKGTMLFSLPRVKMHAPVCI